MSWFARSIANTLKLDDDEKQPVNKNTNVSTDQNQVDGDNLPQSPGRGVKEDLSEITKTLTRQFWGVASFLAPPLPSGNSNEGSEPSDRETEAISGIRRDFAEIGGKFRSGISKLSNNIDVSEISKIASNFLQLESEDEDNDSTDGDSAVGVTDEVVAFARDLAMHPETWLDFPLPEDEDFDLSDAHQEHALAVEHLAPSLNALRIKLCPDHMNESSFWKIYFILLHPKLEHHAAKLLSTPNIVKARALLTLELKTRKSKNESQRNNSYSEATEIVDKSVIQEDPQPQPQPHNLAKGEDEEDEWLKEESSEIVTVNVDEDVSFSDLEVDDDVDDDDDDGNIPIHYKKATRGSDSSTKDSRSWVELGRSSSGGSGTKECNDWLDVVDIDVV